MIATRAALAIVCCACTKPGVWQPVALDGSNPERIDEVSGTAADDLWGVSRPDVFHWDGKRWALSGSPGVEHLAAVAPNDVWGVGRGGLWAHFDGATWSSGHADGVAKRNLDFYGVVAWPGEVWATAGVEGYFRYDGAEWKSVMPAELEGWSLERMTSIGRDVFVALIKSSGTPGKRVFVSRVGHFDGKTWSVIEQPSGLRVRGTAPDDVWIVRKTPMHFDGSQWTQTTLPDDDAVPYDLYARGPSEAYLVGKHGLAMRWDGRTWSEIASGTRDDLFCVIGATTGPVWAGGARGQMLRFPK